MQMSLDRRLRSLGLVVLFVFAAAAPLGAQTSALVIHSAAGDPVGNGRTWTSDISTARFTSFGIRASELTVVVSGDTNWSLNFGSGNAQPLAPGTYLGAQDQGSFPPLLYQGFLPYLRIAGVGQCSTATGRFLVRELIRTTDGTLLRFAADFEQHCADGDPGLTGVIRYNSTIASLVAFDGAVPDYRLIVTRPQHGTITGPGIACGTNHTACVLRLSSPQTVTLFAAADLGYVFMGWNAACLGVETVTLRINQPKQCEPIFEAADVPHTGVYIDSQPGEQVARGLKVLFNRTNATFTSSLDTPGRNGVHINMDGPIFLHTLAFAAPGTQPLVPGTYLSARRAFFDTSHPGLLLSSFFDTYRRCTFLLNRGRFVVYEAVFAADGSVVRFAADAEQHCEDEDAAMFAAVRYNSTIPPGRPFGGRYPDYRLTLAPSAHGVVTGGGLSCGPTGGSCFRILTSPATLTLTAVPEPGYALRGWSGDCAQTGFLVAPAPPTVPLRVHSPRQCQAIFGPIAVTHDLDGDRLGDLVVWRPGEGTWYWGTSSSGFNDAAARSQQFGSSALGDVPFLGDVDGDGIEDLIIWRASTGTWYWRFSSLGYDPAALGSVPWGNRDLGDVPMVGDMDGDSRADFVVWRSSTGTFYWLPSSMGYNPSFAAHSRQWGNASLGDQPILGDFDGDGKQDLAVWRASTGTWYWLPSTAGYAYAAARGMQWGSQAHGDIAFTGDLDGDARSELIVWRPGNGTWYWLTAASAYSHAAQRAQQWGNAAEGDRPALVDLDGDRIRDLAVWRASTGMWRWLQSSTGFDSGRAREKPWGALASGDIPMVR